MDQIKKDHINKYLLSIGLPQSIQLKSSIESLYLLTNKHFIYLPYQNYELHFKDNNPISLQFEDIINRLCIRKMGGLCYEHTLLIYEVLKYYGFNVNIIQCQVREKAQEYNPDQVSAHAFLHITIEDDQYIIDPGFGTIPYKLNNVSQLLKNKPFVNFMQIQININKKYVHFLRKFLFLNALKLRQILQIINSDFAIIYISNSNNSFLAKLLFNRSLRYPLKFNIKNLPIEQELFPQEQYKLTETEKNYQLNHLIDGQWITYYDFDKPLRFGFPEDLLKDYHQIFHTNQYLSVRDNRFMVCQNTEHGRIQYFWFREEKNFTSFKKEFKYDKVEKTIFNNYQELKEDVLRVVQLELPNMELLKE